VQKVKDIRANQKKTKRIKGRSIAYITAIIDFHPCRCTISKAIHKAERAKVPMKTAERIVRERGGTYAEDTDMLTTTLPKSLTPADHDGFNSP
jgi:hypothetical protein